MELQGFKTNRYENMVALVTLEIILSVALTMSFSCMADFSAGSDWSQS